MESEITVENLPLFGTCNLCTNEGIAKSLLLPYDHNGKTELYTDMLMNCFSIDISLIQMGDTKKLICNDCIPRLRDAAEFKHQVEASLKTLKGILDLNNTKAAVKETEKIKTESNDEDDYVNFLDDVMKVDVDDVMNVDDDIPLADFAVKEEDSSEERPLCARSCKKTKSKTKIIKLKRKRTHNLADTEKLLAAGLFPFKIKKSGYVCAICPEHSTSLDDIKTHINEHTKTIIHIAFKKMMFSNSQRFFKKQNMLRCKICTSDISNYEELKEHLDNCTRMKLKKNFKWNHLPFKLEKDQLDCPVCKKKFLNFVNLNTHMNVHYPNYICESCGKAFASAARLRGHMRTHEIGSFPCRYCDAVFDRVTKRENHVSKEHKAGVRYACKRCNISLPSFYARQKHLAEIHNEELKRYKCSACPQSYITPGHLSSHVRRDHLNERNHKCDKCDLAFYTKNALKMHMIKHDGERIFSCHVCQKSYQRKKTLTEHLRIHNNDKRFICPVCGRAFTQKCTLKGHMKVHERKVDVPCADVKSELYIM